MKDISFKGVFSGQKRSEGGASSSSEVVRSEAVEKRLATTPPKGRPQPKKKLNPEEDRPKEEPQPKARGRPQKEPVNPDEPEKTTKSKPVKKDIPKEKKEHGTKIEIHELKDWSKKGRGFLVDQLDLRKISLKKTERIRMTKKDLIAKRLEHDK